MPLRLAVGILFAVVVAAEVTEDGLSFRLEHGATLPLVGVGVGNLQYERITDVVRSVVDNHGVRFIDTAAASKNEKFIVDGLSSGGDEHVHIQTKVVYRNHLPQHERREKLRFRCHLVRLR